MNHQSVPTYYIDSNVFFAVKEEETKRYSRYFFSKLFEEYFIGAVSSITWQEIEAAVSPVADISQKYWQKSLPNLVIFDIKDEVFKLAKTYVESGIVAPKDFLTAMNIGVVSSNRCDYIISWDYQGLANLDTIKKINGINKLLGYSHIEICTPAMIF
jgi:predicted nucleic acid-binding protein